MTIAALAALSSRAAVPLLAPPPPLDEREGRCCAMDRAGESAHALSSSGDYVPPLSTGESVEERFKFFEPRRL